MSTVDTRPERPPGVLDIHRTDDHLWSQIVTLYGRVEHELSAALLRSHGLGLSEYRVLCRLANTDSGEMRMQEIADAVGLTQSSVTRLVARLENSGLTRRDLCPNDRRGVYTVITDEGRSRHSAAMPTYIQTLSTALDHATDDPELATLIRTLRG